MRAAVLRETGGVPRVGDHPDPVERPGRVLVRVTAAPVVPLDLLCASGTSYFGTPATPYVPGVQGVGVLPDGTRAWFATSAGMAPGDGSLAPVCSVADDDVVRLPLDADEPALAALGLSAVAAWMSLTWRGGLEPGERVLVLGGGGAVGQAAIGAARVLGAARVVAVCRPASRERALAAGADEVVEHDGADLAGRLRSACAEPVDLVVDPVFGEVASAAVHVLREGGRLVNLGGSAGDGATFSSALLRSRSISVLGYTNNALSPAQRAEAVRRVAEHAATGAMRVAHTVLPLEEVGRAWETTGRSGVRSVLVPRSQ